MFHSTGGDWHPGKSSFHWDQNWAQSTIPQVVDGLSLKRNDDGNHGTMTNLLEIYTNLPMAQWLLRSEITTFFSDENYSTPKKLSGVALHCLDGRQGTSESPKTNHMDSQQPSISQLIIPTIATAHQAMTPTWSLQKKLSSNRSAPQKSPSSLDPPNLPKDVNPGLFPKRLHIANLPKRQSFSAWLTSRGRTKSHNMAQCRLGPAQSINLHEWK